MIRGLYTAVSGLITQEAKQDVITQNLANANTVGYKGDNLAVKKFNDVLIQNYDKVVGGKNVRNVIGGLSYGSEIDETNTDFTQGILQQTESETDFALNGRGFFTVSRVDSNGNSTPYYTRDGQFNINLDGYLVNSSGDFVMGKNISTNEVEPILVGSSKIVSDSRGNIFLDGRLSHKLNIVDFNDYKSLQKIGDNLYNGTNPVDAAGFAVQQKSVEKSNVNVINEMVNMMTVMRTFESNQKIIQSIDETLGKAVNEVGTIR